MLKVNVQKKKRRKMMRVKVRDQAAKLNEYFIIAQK